MMMLQHGGSTWYQGGETKEQMVLYMRTTNGGEGEKKKRCLRGKKNVKSCYQGRLADQKTKVVHLEHGMELD